MNLQIQAGVATKEALQTWLLGDSEDSIRAWIQNQAGGKTHALVEYVHRFALLDWADFLEDLKKAEVAELSLQGRIFWETGQIAWRRLNSSQCSLCLMSETTSHPSLPVGIIHAEPFEERLGYSEDSSLLLWGTLNREKGVYLEQRVAGSRPLEYPVDLMAIGKSYPLIELRTYFNEEGEPSLWRFLRLNARNIEDWADSTKEDE